MQTRSKTRNAQSALSTTRHPFSGALISTYSPVTPTTYSQAAKSPHWTQAMNEEFQALKTTNTWSLVPHHPSYNVIGCKWVYRVKYNADGSLDRYKAHLVAKGFHQQAGLDFT